MSPEVHTSLFLEKDGVSSDDDDPVSDTSFTLGHSFLDFDSGFIGTHQKLLSDEYNLAGGMHSFLEPKTIYSSVNDIDKYMVGWTRKLRDASSNVRLAMSNVVLHETIERIGAVQLRVHCSTNVE